MPFQYANAVENGTENKNTSTESDPVTDMIEKLECQRTAIFDKASKKIHKAQEVCSRSYNCRNATGTKFEVGQFVLK